MFSLNGDSNTTNNIMSHSVRRSPDTTFSELALDRSGTAAERFLRDDRYFNLLYKNYNNNRNESNSRMHENSQLYAGSNYLDLDGLRNEREKSWTNREIDYRHMDAALARIQNECEQMKMTMERVGLGNASNKAPVTRLDCSSHDFYLVGSGVGSSPQTRAASSNIDLSLDSLPVANASLRHRLVENKYNLPPLPEIYESHAAADVETASISTPDNPIRSALPERLAMEHPFIKKINSDVDAVPCSEPYKCPVCLKCVRQRKPATTVCGHVFCSSCIKTALRATCKCPVCQRIMTTRQIFRIFI